MKTKTVISFFAATFSCTVNLCAQQAVASSGGDITGASGSVSQTIGEPVIATITSSNHILTQGVQQPYLVEDVTGIDHVHAMPGLRVFPNPTANYIVLDDKNWEQQHTYVLTASDGKLLHTDKLRSEQTELSLSDFANGIYFLTVSNSEGSKKTYRIIKTQ